MKDFLSRFINWIKELTEKLITGKVPDLSFYLVITGTFIIFILSLNGFIELTDELFEKQLSPYDERVTSFIKSWENEYVTALMHFVTDLGDRYAYFIIGGALIIYAFLSKQNRRFVLQLTIVIMLSAASNLVLKNWIGRERPVGEHLVHVSTLSYPSGHAMSAMAFYGFLVYIVFKLTGSTALRVIFSLLLILLILSIGISRVYLGVHFPTDVLGGYLGGLIWISFCVIVYNLISFYRKRSATG